MHVSELFSATVQSPLEAVDIPLLAEKDIKLWLKRDDLIHPEISGNKWRKLKYNLLFVAENNYKGIITFGGAFSNHIAAVAAACAVCNIPCIGIIRGERVKNNTLANAAEQGMQLVFVSREEYRLKSTDAYLQKLQNEYPGYYIIPEGGTNVLAIKGTEEIMPELPFVPDYVACAFGTGGTVSGIINSTDAKVLVFPALKGDFMEIDIRTLINPLKNNWEVMRGYEFGGYAKVPLHLIDFVRDFHKLSGVQFDYIYNGKMMYGIMDLIKKDYFKKGSSIIAIHTGGVQGNVSFERIVES